MRRVLIIATIACLAFSACGRKAHTPTHDPLREAYALMDHRQNAEAATLLEGVVAQEPDNQEARLLLASAYIGQAGIDVLSFHDAFKDIFFSRSFADSWKDSARKPEQPAPAPAPAAAVPAPTGATAPTGDAAVADPGPTAVELFVEQMDEGLNDLRRVLLLLNRLPQVPEEKWPLLDKAFSLLDSLQPTKDVVIYRLFVRIIYVREFLVRKVMGDSDVGTRAWLCQLELDAFHDQLRWINHHLAACKADLDFLYPGQPNGIAPVLASFGQIQDRVDYLRERDRQARQADPRDPGSQKLLRDALRCKNR